MGGHYYAYIKPWENEKWYNFNDSCVKLIDEETLKKVYGGTSKWFSSSTAYLLMYRKVDEARNVDKIDK